MQRWNGYSPLLTSGVIFAQSQHQINIICYLAPPLLHFPKNLYYQHTARIPKIYRHGKINFTATLPEVRSDGETAREELINQDEVQDHLANGTHPLIYCVKKFHQYLYGRKFTLVMDHKPLTAIFRSNNGVPSLAAAQLQRGHYSYQVMTTKSSSNQ